MNVDFYFEKIHVHVYLEKAIVGFDYQKKWRFIKVYRNEF
jgi:hypothetical protein